MLPDAISRLFKACDTRAVAVPAGSPITTVIMFGCEHGEGGDGAQLISVGFGLLRWCII